MTNKNIEKQLKAIFTPKQLATKIVDKNTVFALIKYKESKTARKYIPPQWAVSYHGIADITCIYPEDPSAKLIVDIGTGSNGNYEVFAPHAREVLRILTLEEVQNEYPEYLI